MAAGMLIAGGIAAAGNIMQGQATSNALNAQAALQIQNASEAEAQGQYDANKSSLESATKIGAITAGYGASGVTTTSGSALNVLGASAANAELDRLNILHGADVKAINYENQASMEKVGAQSAQIGSFFGAAGSIGAGATKAYATTLTPPSNNLLGGNWNLNE